MRLTFCINVSIELGVFLMFLMFLLIFPRGPSGLLESVLFAEIRFHDTISRGRLLNRFGKDFEGEQVRLVYGHAADVHYY